MLDIAISTKPDDMERGKIAKYNRAAPYLKQPAYFVPIVAHTSGRLQPKAERMLRFLCESYQVKTTGSHCAAQTARTIADIQAKIAEHEFALLRKAICGFAHGDLDADEVLFNVPPPPTYEVLSGPRRAQADSQDESHVDADANSPTSSSEANHLIFSGNHTEAFTETQVRSRAKATKTRLRGPCRSQACSR
jgi:hypothetical protein